MQLVMLLQLEVRGEMVVQREMEDQVERVSLELRVWLVVQEVLVEHLLLVV